MVVAATIGKQSIRAKQVDVIVKTNGQIEQMHVEEGDMVSSGQILATLDGAMQRVQLHEASIRASSLEREYRRSEAMYQQQLRGLGGIIALQGRLSRAGR